MNQLRKLFATLFLVLALGLTVCAEDTPPPCGPPVPGQIQTPPCGEPLVGNNSDGILDTSGYGGSAIVVDRRDSLTEFAFGALELILSLP